MRLLSVFLSMLFLATAASAQTASLVPPQPAAAPQPAQAAAPQSLKLGDWTVSGSVRLRGYGWDWFQATSGDNAYGYSGNLLRVNFAEKRKGWDWDAEFAAPFLLGLPDNATAPAPQGALGLGLELLFGERQ